MSGNHLIGVVSSPIGPVVLSGDPDPNFNGSFALDFSHDTVELARNGTLAATAHATFSVPEPKTLDLVLGALGIGWLTRCLRRRAF